ncbi:MAG: glycosyltransferase, partial [Patescibacteria group bacterium]
MKIALVHDYLREYGGAERVVEVLHEMYPQAPLFTSFVDWNALGGFARLFRGWDIRTSWVQGNWLMKKFHSPLRLLTPLVWESFNLKEYEVIISSSGWFICRGVITHPGQVHISYIHHPPRNLYGFPTGTKSNVFMRIYATVINPFLRIYDYTTAQRVDHLVANSETTRARIMKFYRRDATVIYPPVDVSRDTKYMKRKENVSHLTSHISPYYLSVGRLNYAKRIDLAIEACNKLKLPLKIVGTGKEEANLRLMAGNTIEFLGAVTDDELGELYAGAKALIFCALEEDFGMVPVEA